MLVRAKQKAVPTFTPAPTSKVVSRLVFSPGLFLHKRQKVEECPTHGQRPDSLSELLEDLHGRQRSIAILPGAATIGTRTDDPDMARSRFHINTDPLRPVVSKPVLSRNLSTRCRICHSSPINVARPLKFRLAKMVLITLTLDELLDTIRF